MPDFVLTNELRAAMLAHAELEFPRECCGLLARDADGALYYLPAANAAPPSDDGQDRFLLDPQAYPAVEDHGHTVLAVVHSHPGGTAVPSMADRARCERSGLPWLVVAWPGGTIKRLEPEGWQAPLVGRVFHHGVLDCYTLIQDYYRRTLRIELPDFDREDDWWTTGGDLYATQFELAGFVRVHDAPRQHDGLLMQVQSPVWNHAAIYSDDDVILHHLHGRLSCHDTYGSFWRRHTRAVVRHISRIKPSEAAALLLAA